MQLYWNELVGKYKQIKKRYTESNKWPLHVFIHVDEIKTLINNNRFKLKSYSYKCKKIWTLMKNMTKVRLYLQTWQMFKLKNNNYNTAWARTKTFSLHITICSNMFLLYSFIYFTVFPCKYKKKQWCHLQSFLQCLP